MDFVLIFSLAFCAIIVSRILVIFLYNLGKVKVENKEKTENRIIKIMNMLEPIMYSLVCLCMFFAFWAIAVVMLEIPGQTNESLKNLVWYVVFTFFGVAAIIWCYFHWDFKWKAIPKFEDDKIVIALKKIIVFSVVMGFAFYHGYKQMEAIFNDVKIDSTLTIYNVTLISGIIALDRVLNQVLSIYKEWKDKEKEQNENKKND